jgi:hypothetical protein
MTGEKRMFSSYEKNHDPQRAITFGDGNQGLVKGLGKIAISPDHSESRLEGGVNRVNLKFINLSTTTSRVSVRNMNESERERVKNKSRANKE